MHRACKVFTIKTVQRTTLKPEQFVILLVRCMAKRTCMMEAKLENTSRVRRVKEKTDLSILWSNPYLVYIWHADWSSWFKFARWSFQGNGGTGFFRWSYRFDSLRAIYGFPGHTFCRYDGHTSAAHIILGQLTEWRNLGFQMTRVGIRRSDWRNPFLSAIMLSLK